MNILIRSFLLITLFTIYSVENKTCTCSCCLTNGCTPSVIGNFFQDQCNDDDCINSCYSKYPSLCINNLGNSNGECSSNTITIYLTKSNLFYMRILTVVIVMFLRN